MTCLAAFPTVGWTRELIRSRTVGSDRQVRFARQEFLDRHSDRVDSQGRRLVVRNGHLPPQDMLTGAGLLELRQPRGRDKSADPAGQARFSSQILPPYLRKTKAIEELIPWLYLKGVLTGGF